MSTFGAADLHDARQAVIGQRLVYRNEWHSVVHIDNYGVWLFNLERVDQVPFLSDLGISQRPVSYNGPDESVECAYPPCANRLRRSDFPGPQWCSKNTANRRASERSHW